MKTGIFFCSAKLFGLGSGIVAALRAASGAEPLKSAQEFRQPWPPCEFRDKKLAPREVPD